MRHDSKGSGIVYSTEGGRMCPGCGQPADACRCSKGSAPAGDGVVRISRQTKGRKGKGVTLVTGLPLDESALLALSKRLKQRCGAGGAVKDGAIEIQGDHRQTILAELTSLGHKPKLAGG